MQYEYQNRVDKYAKVRYRNFSSKYQQRGRPALGFEEFLAKQEQVYARFRAQEAVVRQKGLNIDAAVYNELGGFVIAWKHPVATARAVAELSRKIGKIVPAMEYPAWSVHTTLSDHMVSPGFRVSAGSEEHWDILEALSASVKKAVLDAADKNLQQCEIHYSAPWLCNQTTVIAQGIPNVAFMALGDAVRSACKERGVALRPPWGAHITVARFRTQTDPKKAESLLQLLQATSPIGTSVPEALEVGFFSMAGGNFTYEVHQRLPLE